MGWFAIVEKIEDAVRLRYLGVGFVWAWIYCAFETSAVYADRHGISINSDAAWLASAAAVTLALFALGFAFRNTRLIHSKWVPCAGALLMACGTLASGLLANDALVFASGAATGIGSAILLIFWGDALSLIDAERAEIAVPAASAVTLACVFMFPYVQGIAGMVGVSLLPLLSLACLAFTYAEIEKGNKDVCAAAKESVSLCAAHAEAKTSARYKAGIPYVSFFRMVLTLFLAYFVVGCVAAQGEIQDAFQAEYGFDAGTFVGQLCGIVLALWFIFFSRRVDLHALFRWLSPFMILGVAMMPCKELVPNFVLVATMSVADTVLQTIVFLYFLNLANRGAVSAALGVGVSQGFVQLGVLLGNLAGNAAGSLVQSGSLELWAIAMALVCLLSFCGVLLPSYGFELEEASGKGMPVASANPVQGFSSSACCGVSSMALPDAEDEKRNALLVSMAHAYGLSARETEILGYLARGRSQPYIRDELVLSKNTVATHVKHIYQKLGVHSRQEVLDLFE